MPFAELEPTRFFDQKLIDAGHSPDSYSYSLRSAPAHVLYWTVEDPTIVLALDRHTASVATVPPGTVEDIRTHAWIVRLGHRVALPQPALSGEVNALKLTRHVSRHPATLAIAQWVAQLDPAGDEIQPMVGRLATMCTRARKHRPTQLVAIGKCGPPGNFQEATLWADDTGQPYAVSAALLSRDNHDRLGTSLYPSATGGWETPDGVAVGVNRPRWLHAVVAPHLFSPTAIDL